MTSHGEQPDRIRATQGDTLVWEEWFDDEGLRLALVEPVDEPYPTKSGRAVAVERWTAFDGAGARRAEGLVRAGNGGPIGPWRLFDPARTVTFTPLRVRRRRDLGHIAEVLHRWREAPPLPGVDDVRWTKLETLSGSAKHFPFFLKGLTVPDPLAVDLAIEHMYDAVLHEGSLAEVAGPTVRFVVAALGTVDRPGTATSALDLLVRVASRDRLLDSARDIRRLYHEVPDGADPVAYFGGPGAEPAYHEVLSVLGAAAPLWTEWAGDADETVRLHCLHLLALAPGDAARAALLRRIGSEPERRLRAESLLGLVLHEPDEAMAATLGEHLAGDDPLLRFCAALTWVRQELPDAGFAVHVILDGMTAPDEIHGFELLSFSLARLTTDVAITLELLPEGEVEQHVARIAGTLDEADPADATRVANALLEVAFPFAVEHYRWGAELTPVQRVAMEAIAASDNAWTVGVPLAEMLCHHGLPPDRDTLRAIVEGRVLRRAGPRLPVVDAGIRPPA